MKKTEKTCAVCEETKSIKSFRRKKMSRDGYSRSCDTCTKGLKSPNEERAYVLDTKYGMTPGDYDAMLKEQDHKCAICRTKEEDAPGGILCVDHNHKTGAVRALLCSNCNRGIGFLKDSPTVLRKAAEYLDTHGNYCSHTTTHPEEG